MIIVEERLRELFETLPPIIKGDKSYKSAFNFGSHEDLLNYLSKRGSDTYPLIWLETPITKNGKENRITIDLKLIIAINSNANTSNSERLNISFKPSLIPLYKNILKSLKQSGFTKIIEAQKNKRTDFYNYGVKEKNSKEKKHIATDIWDAIKFECELELTDCKQKNINY